MQVAEPIVAVTTGRPTQGRIAMGLMFRRRRPIARLAVGAATAGVAYHAGQRRSQQDQYNQQAQAAYDSSQQAPEQQYAPPPQYVPPPPQYSAPPAEPESQVDELKRLATLHDSGALTDEEFTAAKAQILGL
jgi:hypothetical protein